MRPLMPHLHLGSARLPCLQLHHRMRDGMDYLFCDAAYAMTPAAMDILNRGTGVVEYDDLLEYY